MKKKLPIGISNLKKIITEGYVYVDKTRYVCELVNTGVYYFLSRPRRFGKSLFVDTLKEAFDGNKDLFQGLYIYDKWDWSVKYPVININFAEGVLKSREKLDKRIIDILRVNQKRLGIQCIEIDDVTSCFIELIDNAKEKYGQNVVILIDEYDKPILDNITEPEIAKEMREGLKNLYSVIKGQDANIKFVFLTGVSKFSKISIFSGLNNLRDITIDANYSSICGYTEDELTIAFEEHLKDKDFNQIRHWYNGYSWTGVERVYNPFSIINYLQTGVFRNYWFESGTPTFLIELLKQRRYYIPQIENIEAGESLIGSFDVDFIEPENLLFQSGYLTIISTRTIVGNIIYKLTYPNFEVKTSLLDYILKHYSVVFSDVVRRRIRLYEELERCNVDAIREIIQSHFASIPHHWYKKNDIEEYEGFYSSVFYSYFASLGLNVRPEDITNHGNIDMTVVMNHAVFIFEFKVIERENEASTGLQQIKDMNYAEKYKGFNLPIYLIVIDFDKRTRNVSSFQWERY
ncbi:MAG TPA: ATP-binding protein [Nitrospirae bacterium]|nr:ATP-binding protein [Nitrospirota bacterium]